MNKLMKIITIENVSDMNDYFFHDTLKKYKEEINLIVSNVKQNGDSALRKYEKKFGNVKIKSFKVTTQEIDNAYSCINKEQISAIKFIKNKLLQTELILKRQFKNRR